MIALLLATALAAEPGAAELSAWSVTAVEGVTDLDARSDFRAYERLSLDTEVATDIRLLASGALRISPSPHPRWDGDVYRLALHEHGRLHRVTAGRFARLDPRGFQRLDGVAVDLGRGVLVGSGWLGHQWHPETWLNGDAIVGGAQIQLRPPNADGEASRTQRLTAGWELRGGDQLLAHRGYLSWAAHGPRGGTASVLGELGLGDDAGWRASARGMLPVTRALDLGADLRWEDLPPATARTVRTPMDWLSPGGYGAGAVHARVRGGPWSLAVTGGGSYHPECAQELGGLGRASVGWTERRTTLEAFFLTTGVGTSWLAGGGARTRWSSSRVHWDGELGIYRFQPLDGAADTLWEGTLKADVPVAPLILERPKASVVFDATTGRSRTLQPYVRGGVAVRVGVGRPL